MGLFSLTFLKRSIAYATNNLLITKLSWYGVIPKYLKLIFFCSSNLFKQYLSFKELLKKFSIGVKIII